MRKLRTKHMTRKIVFLLVVLMLLWPGAGWAMPPITQAMTIAKDELMASGKQSNDQLTHSIIDMVYVSSGSVTSYTYAGNNEDLTVNIFSVQAQTNTVAADKLTRYAFDLNMQYRPDTQLSISFSMPDYETVNAYTYGTLKNELMLAIITGIPDCLINLRLGDSSHSSSNTTTDTTWKDKYSPENMVFTSFKIGDTTYTATDGSIVTMDVAPEIKGDRTFVPVRYLAYALGVPEEGVKWDGTTKTVTIKNGDTTVGLTIGSTMETVNGKPVKMDVAPYVKEIDTGGRTMLPARWVAEPLGAKVTWDEVNQKAIIEIPRSQEQGQE